MSWLWSFNLIILNCQIFVIVAISCEVEQYSPRRRSFIVSWQHLYSNYHPSNSPKIHCPVQRAQRYKLHRPKWIQSTHSEFSYFKLTLILNAQILTSMSY
jgi:hypothetical protein